MPASPELYILLKPNLYFIQGDSREGAIVLDDTTGRYWQLLDSTLQVLLRIKDSAGILPVSCLMSSDNADTDHNYVASKVLDDLQKMNLVELCHIKEEIVFNQPSLGLVLTLAWLNLWYRALLRVQGWTPVYRIRRKQLEDAQKPDHTIPQLRQRPDVINEIIAASRLACIFPWVQRSCVPSSLAIYRLLRNMGYSPLLVVGAEVTPFEPHMWVELSGYRIDSDTNEQSLQIFKRLS